MSQPLRAAGEVIKLHIVTADAPSVQHFWTVEAAFQAAQESAASCFSSKDKHSCVMYKGHVFSCTCSCEWDLKSAFASLEKSYHDEVASRQLYELPLPPNSSLSIEKFVCDCRGTRTSPFHLWRVIEVFQFEITHVSVK